MKQLDQSRRRFLHTAGATVGLGALGLARPAIASAAGLAAPAVVSSGRAALPLGLQLGDPSIDGIVVWARSDRVARMIVEYSEDPSFHSPIRRVGPLATEATDMTARMFLDLTRGRSYHVRVAFDNPFAHRGLGPYLEGRFQLPSWNSSRPIRFLWSGDMAGQGWGINPEFGGARIYEAMRQRNPGFFIHSGDTIYADGPITAEVKAENNRIWKNIVTEEVSKVAETLKEFRGRHRYNMLDDNVARFSREIPQIWQWDDHEVVNNWSASKDLSADARYTIKDVNLLIARGRRAFLENAPMRWDRIGSGPRWAPVERWEQHWSNFPDRVYRHIPYGPLLDIFVVDMRSYRGPNTYNLQTFESGETAFLGNAQIDWLVRNLSRSRATWKVIVADMPLALHIPDGTDAQGRPKWEAVSNGTDGRALGRELEIARLLGRIKLAGVKNVVWLTADVHRCAAHYYDSGKATYQNFSPFWEFVAGPLNAGSFSPTPLDNTFGPQLVFTKSPPAGVNNLSPFAGLQFFGEVNIDPYTKAMTVDLRDIDGLSVFSQTIVAQI